MGRRSRVLAIGLDGLEISYAERLMAEGQLPALRALRERSARFLLDHGSAVRTGLAWEHFASGLSPDQARRWAAVEFDPESYETWQQGVLFPPFYAGIDARTVVFDPPYVDLDRAPGVRGVVGWGAHDPGCLPASRPAELIRSLGAYPASRWTYGLPWPTRSQCRRMGRGLAEGLAARRAGCLRLLESLPDWDLFLVVAGEPHSAVEGLWHGVDPEHPLHRHPSSPAAAAALEEVHRALDRLVGDVVAAAPEDAYVLAFAMGGMGRNQSDLQSMVLLPELLHRHAFGQALLQVPDSWAREPAGMPPLDGNATWHDVLADLYPPDPSADRWRRAMRRLPGPLRGALRARSRWLRPRAEAEDAHLSLAWMPATRYRDRWPEMRAFALPSFYDGRVRINLAGREARGRVPLGDYEHARDAIESLVRDCRDPRTGAPVVEAVERPTVPDPRELPTSQSDLVIVWRGTCNAFVHPELGTIGPVPFRRTGGHTGPHGCAFVAGPGVEPGPRELRPSFDVAPTIADLLGFPEAVGGGWSSLLTVRPESVPARAAR